MASTDFIKQLREQNWPQEFHEKLKIGNLQSNVGIATLWTFQETVFRGLNPDSYAVIGNFYDKQNAIEPFVRNCLANPNIRYVLLLGNDKSGSKQILINFFEKGFSENKIIGTDTTLPKGIPIEDIEQLRKNVELIDLSNQIKNLDSPEEYSVVINAAISKLEKKEPYSEPRFYEKPKLDLDSFPSERVGFIARGNYVGEVWLKILRNLYDYGAITKMKINDSTKIRLCVNMMAIIDKEDPDSPKMEPYFRFDEKYLKEYHNEICSPQIPEGTLYTYGSRLRAWESKNGEKIDQIADVISYLKPDIFRASAIAQTWIVEDELTRRYLNKDKNSPCIVLVHPIAPDGVLHMTVYIRSNDMFRAWPLNAFGLRKLQKIIAQGLGLEMGSLITISSSAHIYQDNWPDAKDILNKYYAGTNCFFDTRGYYIIRLKDKKINVQHFSPDSRLLKEYESQTAREINDVINSSQHPIDSYHSSYLGEELMKAEIALKLGINYFQDTPLDFGSAKSGN